MKIYFTYSPSDETSQTTIGRLRLELAKKGLHAQIRPLSPLTDNDGDPDQALLQEVFYELCDAGYGLEGQRKPTRYARRFIDRFRKLTSAVS